MSLTATRQVDAVLAAFALFVQYIARCIPPPHDGVFRCPSNLGFNGSLVRASDNFKNAVPLGLWKICVLNKIEYFGKHVISFSPTSSQLAANGLR